MGRVKTLQPAVTGFLVVSPNVLRALSGSADNRDGRALHQTGKPPREAGRDLTQRPVSAGKLRASHIALIASCQMLGPMISKQADYAMTR